MHVLRQTACLVVIQKKYIKLLLAYIFTVPILILYPKSRKIPIIILLFSDYYAKLFVLYVTCSVLLPFLQLPCNKDREFKFPTDQLAT